MNTFDWQLVSYQYAFIPVSQLLFIINQQLLIYDTLHCSPCYA